MKNRSLSAIIKKFFPDEPERKHASVDLRERWVLFKKVGAFSSWYPRPVEFVETDTYLFFDRRRANIYKAAAYGVAVFIIVAGLTFVFFGYLTLLFLGFSLLIGGMFLVLFYAAARSLTFGIIVIPKSWISGVGEKQGWIIVEGRKGISGCKSIVCTIEPWQTKEMSPLEQLWHALDAGPFYDSIGEGRFEVRYRAARMRR